MIRRGSTARRALAFLSANGDGSRGLLVQLVNALRPDGFRPASATARGGIRCLTDPAHATSDLPNPRSASETSAGAGRPFILYRPFSVPAPQRQPPSPLLHGGRVVFHVAQGGKDVGLRRRQFQQHEWWESYWAYAGQSSRAFTGAQFPRAPDSEDRKARNVVPIRPIPPSASAAVATNAADCDEAIEDLEEARKRAVANRADEKRKLAAEMPSLATRIVKGGQGVGKWIYETATMDRKQWAEAMSKTWAFVKKEAHHYWTGTKLLGYEIRVAAGILLRVARGKELSRREKQQLVTTAADIFRLVPLIIILVVPLMEFALPFLLRLFPNMLPSTYEDKLQKEETLKNRLKAKIEVARFLQDTVAEMAKGMRTADREQRATAGELEAFMAKVRAGRFVSNADIVRFAKLFNDELTLDNISRAQLVGMCQFLGISPYGTDTYLRYQLRQRLKWLKSDDRIIRQEGLEALTPEELRAACRARGMQWSDRSVTELRQQLNEWLELSLNHSLPSSLLILSRAFTITADREVGPAALASADMARAAIDTVKETLSALPSKVVSEAEVAITPSDKTAGLARKLEYLKAQEAIIAQEATEREHVEKVVEKDLALEEMRHATAAQAAPAAAKLRAAAAAIGFPGGTLAASPAEREALTAAARKRAMAQIGQALASLAADSAVSAERADFLALVRKEVDRYQQEAQQAAIPKAAPLVPVAGSEPEEEVVPEDGAEAAKLSSKVSDLLKKIERELDSVEMTVGDKMQILDKDHDGQITAEELSAAASLLKDKLLRTTIDGVLLQVKGKDGKVAVEDIAKLASAMAAATAAGESGRIVTPIIPASQPKY